MGDFHKHWRISVESHGDLIVAIETECLAGRELSETDVATVNHAISHLNGFMGNPDTITALEEENADARAVLDRIDAIAKAADAAPLCMGEIQQLIAMHRAALEGE